MRLPGLTKTEREALGGKSTQNHRTALSRLRQQNTEAWIALVIECAKALERSGRTIRKRNPGPRPHVLDALAEAARDAARNRDERISKRLRSIHTRPIGKDELKAFKKRRVRDRRLAAERVRGRRS